MLNLSIGMLTYAPVNALASLMEHLSSVHRNEASITCMDVQGGQIIVALTIGTRTYHFVQANGRWEVSNVILRPRPEAKPACP